MEALAQDEQAARALLEVDDDQQAPQERWSEWSPERDALARIDDRLQDLTRAVVAAVGGKPGQFTPAQRPSSALQRLRRQQRREEHQALTQRVLRH